jgi:hypothetical protein
MDVGMMEWWKETEGTKAARSKPPSCNTADIADVAAVEDWAGNTSDEGIHICRKQNFTCSGHPRLQKLATLHALERT